MNLSRTIYLWRPIWLLQWGNFIDFGGKTNFGFKLNNHGIFGAILPALFILVNFFLLL